MTGVRSFLLLLILLIAPIQNVLAHHVPLFDGSGAAIGVIDTNDANTLYLTTGQAVGYIFEGEVYTFTGKFLGWYSNGVLWDKKGYMVAFVQISKPRNVQIKQISHPVMTSVKQKKPAIVTIREIPPAQPKYVYELSTTSFPAFFNLQTEQPKSEGTQNPKNLKPVKAAQGKSTQPTLSAKRNKKKLQLFDTLESQKAPETPQIITNTEPHNIQKPARPSVSSAKSK